MSNTPVCWQCGASLAALSLPYSRFDACKACGADLHVCKLCLFHAPAIARQCREPIAEEVKDKQRSNVCDYFTPRNDAFQPITAPTDSRAQLDALFGAASTSAPRDAISDRVQHKADAAAAAQAALDDLFAPRK